MSRAVDLAIDSITDRYNPENDIIPNAPVVTWADMELLYAVKSLQKQVDELRLTVLKLQNEIEGRK